MKKVLVLGAAGMAGHVVSLYLRENGYSVSTLSARNKLDKNTTLIDVTGIKALHTYLEKKSFDVIINCIGLLIQPSEERKDLAVYLNAYLPHYLENYYKDSKTKIIHLSTDCVFSGKNPPYKEDSAFDGELFYDRSKALGEIINEKDLTFRMSIIGPDMQESGVGLFNWFYAQKGEIFGYTKAVWNGITTIELARAITAAIEQNLTGLYQLVPQGNITKYNLLKLFKEEFGRNDITINSKDEVALDKTLVNTRKDFDFQVSNYPDMIKDMKVWVEKHNNLYRHYKK